MNITITGKNFSTYQYLEDTIEKKFEKLNKYFSDDIDAKVVLSQERGRDKIEVNINAKGAIFKTEQTANKSVPVKKERGLLSCVRSRPRQIEAKNSEALIHYNLFCPKFAGTNTSGTSGPPPAQPFQPSYRSTFQSREYSPSYP